MKRDFARLAKALHYTFQDQHLLNQALTHRSFGTPHNERLEFLGDAVLNLVTAELLYHQFPHAQEGELTRLRVLLVKGETLAEIATELSLADYIYLGEGERKSGGFRRASILADTVEAVLGAIYLEAGFSEAARCLKEWLASRVLQLSLGDVTKDPKTQLQEYLQARQLPLPVYEVLTIQGDAHDQIFTVSCMVSLLKKTTQGTGRNRRFAEQQAAAIALEELLKQGL